MSEVKKLVYSIIQFLSEQLQSGSLTADATESIEVAVQCLEQAYGISHDDASGRENSKKLLEMFKEATANEECNSEKLADEPSPDAKAKAEELKNKGNELMKTERFVEAVECYTRAIDLDGRNAIYFCNRAAALSKLNSHDKAILDCEKAIRIDRNYSKAYGRKGLAHASLNQHQQAKDCYEKAVTLDPDNESYQNNLRIAEEKLKEANLGSGVGGVGVGGGVGGMFGMDSGQFNLSNLLSNPALMNMATQMMSDPNMQNLLGNILSNQSSNNPSTNPAGGAGGAAGVQALLQAYVVTADGDGDRILSRGQQLAAQMQASNPDLVEQLRRQMHPGDGNPPNPDPK